MQTPHGELPVFVTHLNWKLHHGSVRLRQVVAIAERICELCPIGEARLPPVLMGDFNADPDSDEIRFLRGAATIDGKSVYFADAWGHAGQGPGYTFDRKNRFAALAHEPPRRIDYIFVRGPDRLFRGEPIATRLAFCTLETRLGRRDLAFRSLRRGDRAGRRSAPKAWSSRYAQALFAAAWSRRSSRMYEAFGSA